MVPSELAFTFTTFVKLNNKNESLIKTYNQPNQYYIKD